ncbi:MAG: NAD(+)/NADH kinase, partial [Methylomonas sp.]|nr:NAD(+)/NADH kinase [Methylomonas sp.]
MPTPFHRIGIIGKFGDPGNAPTLAELIAFLQGRGHEVLVDSQSAEFLAEVKIKSLHVERLPEYCDLIIAVGGDGTFLAAARAAADFDIPLIGVNLGRLGFLTDISPQQLTSRLEHILDGRYKTESRALLQAAIVRDGNVMHRQTAVNEVVVHRWVTPSMIEIDTLIDGIYLNTQRSDGLIVAT